MSHKFVVAAGLLVCSVCSLSAMAGSKPVDLILRVLVDAPATLFNQGQPGRVRQYDC